MHRVEELVCFCRSHGVEAPTLLIVPGLDWSERQLDLIRYWSEQGCVLAGHGWQHQCDRIKTWKHRLHSLTISRNVAEHLSLEPSQEIDLLHRCADWFESRGFQLPKLYVPPAWTLGVVNMAELSQQPFQLIETLTGVLVTHTQQQIRLPLLGFEADTRFRSQFLRAFNWLNMLALQKTKASIRISIHPNDHRLYLADALANTLSREWKYRTYEELLS